MTEFSNPAPLGILARFAGHAVELAEALADHAPAQLSTRSVVELAAELVPAATHVDLSTWQQDRFVVQAANRDYAQPLDDIRNDTHEGPCFDALTTDGPTLGDELLDDPRWPRYGPHVARAAGATGSGCPTGGPVCSACTPTGPTASTTPPLAAGALLAACCTLASIIPTAATNRAS